VQVVPRTAHATLYPKQNTTSDFGLLLYAGYYGSPAYTTTRIVDATEIGVYTTLNEALDIAPPPPAATVPTAGVLGATDITASSANLTGSVDPNGAATTALFQWTADAAAPTTPNTVTWTDTGSQVTGAGTDEVALTPVAVTGLSDVTNYYFRLKATNSQGTIYSAVSSFTTLALPSTGAPSHETRAVEGVGAVRNVDESVTFTRTLTGVITPVGGPFDWFFAWEIEANEGSPKTYDDSLTPNAYANRTTGGTIAAGTAPVEIREDITVTFEPDENDEARAASTFHAALFRESA
jgi:hypothetical protein